MESNVSSLSPDDSSSMSSDTDIRQSYNDWAGKNLKQYNDNENPASERHKCILEKMISNAEKAMADFERDHPTLIEQ
jgi:hypothetical protein